VCRFGGLAPLCGVAGWRVGGGLDERVSGLRPEHVSESAGFGRASQRNGEWGGVSGKCVGLAGWRRFAAVASGLRIFELERPVGKRQIPLTLLDSK
jgi:hypothetical protein